MPARLRQDYQPSVADHRVADRRILVVDQDAGRLERLIGNLTATPGEVTSARTWREAQIATSMQTFDVIFVDWAMVSPARIGPGSDATAGYSDLLKGVTTPQVIIALTDEVTPRVRKEAIGLGAVACLQRTSLTGQFLGEFLATAAPSAAFHPAA